MHKYDYLCFSRLSELWRAWRRVCVVAIMKRGAITDILLLPGGPAHGEKV